MEQKTKLKLAQKLNVSKQDAFSKSLILQDSNRKVENKNLQLLKSQYEEALFQLDDLCENINESMCE